AAAAAGVSGRRIPAVASSAPPVRPARRAARWQPARATATWTTIFRSDRPGASTMSFAPLLDAAPAIPLHAFAAMTAFALGIVQFAAPKGTLPHRTIGWVWVGLMAAVAISSLWIH